MKIDYNLLDLDRNMCLLELWNYSSNIQGRKEFFCTTMMYKCCQTASENDYYLYNKSCYKRILAYDGGY